MSPIVNIYEAKTHLSKLVDQAASGQDVILARNGKPAVRITALDLPKPKIKFALLKGKIVVPDNFDESLPDDVLASFEGE